MATPSNHKRTLQLIIGASVLTFIVALGYVITRPACTTNCGTPDPALSRAGDTTPSTTAKPASLPPTANQSLINALLTGPFPAIKLSVPHASPESSVRNGPQLSDQQLQGGVQAEVVFNLPATDARNEIDYDIFNKPGDPSAWFKTFTLGMYRQYQVHSTYAPKGIANARCEQFSDNSGGRVVGGTQCFALVGAVVVYGESIIYDTAAGSPADAETMLKAGISYLNGVG